VKGSYGKTPWPIDPDFRLKICGTREETPYDTSKYRKQPNLPVAEAGGSLLALDEKEELLLELFPSVAEKYLKGQRIAAWEKANGGTAPAAAPGAIPGVASGKPAEAGRSLAIDASGIQYFTVPAFSSGAAPLPPDYAVEDGHSPEYWQYAVENAE